MLQQLTTQKLNTSLDKPMHDATKKMVVEKISIDTNFLNENIFAQSSDKILKKRKKVKYYTLKTIDVVQLLTSFDTIFKGWDFYEDSVYEEIFI